MNTNSDVLFAQELEAENQHSNTFSTLKLNINVQFDQNRVLNSLFKLITKKYTADDDWVPMFTILHECTHFWHWIGTTLGFYSSRLTMAQSYYVHMIMKDLDKAGFDKFPVPLIELDVDQIPHEFQENVEAAVKLWKSLEYHKQALLGYEPDFPLDAHTFFHQVYPDVFSALVGFDRATRQFGPPGVSDYESIYADSDRKSYKSILTPGNYIYQLIHSSEGKLYPISGRAILEGAAIWQEISLLGQMMGFIPDGEYSSRFQLYSGSIYGVCFRLASRYLDPFKEVAALRFLPYLFDLAMMGMFDPLYTEPITDDISWLDIYPGIRFHRALIAAKELNFPNPLYAPDDAYLELVDKICKREKWLSPSEMTQHAERFTVKSFEEHELYHNLPKFTNLNPYSEVRRRHCEAMKARKQDPVIFINILEKFPDLFGAQKPYDPPLRPTMVVGDEHGIVDFRILGFFIFHKLMKEIASGSLNGLNEQGIFPNALREHLVSDEVDQQHPGLYGATVNLMVLFVWNRIGFSKERFVNLTDWP